MSLVPAFQLLAGDERYIQDTREITVNKLFHQQTSDFFTIVPGIKGGQQVAAMKGFEYVTVASTGCGGKGISPDFPAFSQQWNPKRQEVKISICYTDFEKAFTQWQLNDGYAVKDLENSGLDLFIQQFIIEAMQKDLQRMVLLSDADIATQGVLTDPATYVPFYDTIDKGLIPTLQYLATLPEFAGSFGTIPQNAAATTAAQMTFVGEDAVKIYEDLILETYEFDGDILLSSNKLSLAYDRFLRRGNGYGLQSALDNTQNCSTQSSVACMPITPIKNYDRWKIKDFTTAGKVHIPHFALNTRKEYLQVGVDSVAALEDLTMEYIGGEQEMFWFKGNYMLDFKMTNPYALKAAL